MSRFVENTSHALLGTVIIIALLLVTTETHHTMGNWAFPRIFQGKVIGLSIIIPLYIAFSLQFLSNPTWEHWMVLCFTAMAGVSMSATMALLLPAATGIIAIAFFMTDWSLDRKNFKFLEASCRILLYFTSVLYCIVYDMFLLFQTLFENVGNSFELNGPETFLAQLKIFLVEDSLLNPTPILVVLSLVLAVVVLKHWQQRFILIWNLSLIILFLNPLAFKLLVGTLIPQNVYWRFFYLAPIPLSAGLLTSALVQMPYLRRKIAVGLVIAILGLSVGIYISHFYKLNQLELSRHYKIVPYQLNSANGIVEVAPAGVMLSPTLGNLYGIIPMLESGHPQIAYRHDGNEFLLSSEDQQVRVGAQEFVSGNPAQGGAFIDLLEQNYVDVIVLESFVLNRDGEVGEVLERSGYVNHAVTGNYTIYWR